MNFNLQFLGTCACDYSPKLEKEFKNCFDNDARRSSSLLVNDTILIDCGEHTKESLNILKIPFSQIRDIFITHTHDDHFNAENVQKIAENRHVPLRLWINEDAKIPEIPNVEVIRMQFFKEYTAQGNKVVSMPANHDPSASPQHFVISNGEKSFFYGCDGAWFLTSTYNYLYNKQLDMVVLDATVGDYEGDYRLAEHNSIPMIKMMLPSLKTNKTINDNTKIVLSHIAPSLHKSHKETVEIAKKFGANVAFDGMKMEI